MDERVVYGVHCVWWDSIHQTVNREGLPSCPYCGSVLFEMASEKIWFKKVDRYEKDGHPGYRKFVEWLRGKCFKTYDVAWKVYKIGEVKR